MLLLALRLLPGMVGTFLRIVQDEYSRPQAGHWVGRGPARPRADLPAFPAQASRLVSTSERRPRGERPSTSCRYRAHQERQLPGPVGPRVKRRPRALPLRRCKSLGASLELSGLQYLGLAVQEQYPVVQEGRRECYIIQLVV